MTSKAIGHYIGIIFDADEAKALHRLVDETLWLIDQNERKNRKAADDLERQCGDVKRRLQECVKHGNFDAAERHKHTYSLLVRDWAKASAAADDDERTANIARELRGELDLFRAEARHGR